MVRLLELLGIPDTHSFRIQHFEQIRLVIEQNKLHRKRRWAESIAVGSRSYVAKIEESLQYRQLKFIIEEEDGACTIWESCAIYSKSQAGLFYPPPPQDFVKRKKQGAKSQLNTIYYPVYELTD